MTTKRTLPFTWTSLWGILILAGVLAGSTVTTAFEGTWSLSLKNQQDQSDIPLTFQGEAFSGESLSGTAKVTHHPFGQQVRIDINSSAQRDRGLTLRYALKIDAVGKNWCSVVGCERVIPKGTGLVSDSFNYNPRDFLVDGRDNVKWKNYRFPKQSLSFLGSIYDEKNGIAIAVPRDQFRMFNIFYDGKNKEFAIEYYFGLAPETLPPEHADFTFYITKFKPSRYAARSVFQKYYSLFPAFTAKKLNTDGMMLPFVSPYSIKSYDEFGTGLTWGNRNAQGVPGCFYTVPGQLFFNCSGTSAKELLEAIEKKFPGQGAAESICRNAKGEPVVFPNTYADYRGTVNNDPAFPYGQYYLNMITKRIRSDSSSSGVCYDGLLGGLNYNRKHFAKTRFPLMYDPVNGKCVINSYYSCLELARAVRAEFDPLKKIIIANCTDKDYLYGLPNFDVVTSEHSINITFTELAKLRQAMNNKTVALLLKTIRNTITTEQLEQYMQKCMAFGVFPGIFDKGSSTTSGSSYFANPHWFEHDRPMWRKYLTLIREQAQAGWNVLPNAYIDGSNAAAVERFGDTFYAVRALDAAPEATLVVSSGKPTAPDTIVVDEFSGKELSFTQRGNELLIRLPLAKNDVKLISVNTRSSLRARLTKRIAEKISLRRQWRQVEDRIGDRLTMWPFGEEYKCYAVDRKVVHSGSQSITNTSRRIAARQTFFLARTEVNELTLGAWCKCDAASGSPRIIIKACEWKVPSRFAKPQELVFSSGTHDWQYKELKIKTEKPVGGVYLTLSWGGKGRVWFDDVTLTEKGVDLVHDSGFEEVLPSKEILAQGDKFFDSLEKSLHDPEQFAAALLAPGDFLTARDKRDLEEFRALLPLMKR